MTDQQINQAIAKACGWTEIHDSGVWHHHKLWGYPPLAPGAGGNSYQYMPDYCTDLNAMFKAEMTLTSVQLLDYIAMLFDSCYEATVASARQRAEAFLRTLGKWKPTTKESSADHLRDGTKMMGGAK